jgi:hypothetical protein
MPRRFLFRRRFSPALQRQRKELRKHMGNTHAASYFFPMQCSIFSLADAQQIS